MPIQKGRKPTTGTISQEYAGKKSGENPEIQWHRPSYMGVSWIKKLFKGGKKYA
jgi:hypothetical protein